MANDVGVPSQPFVLGVTVTVAITGVFPGFRAVNTGRLSFPLAGRPRKGVSFVHE